MWALIPSVLLILMAFASIIILSKISAILDVILMVGGVILFFLGILGEYVLQINTRVLKRPFVIEEERINF